MLKNFFIMTLVLLFVACSQKTQTFKGGCPEWYWAPSKGDVIGGVGEAGFNVQGKSAQRQLAVARAIDEIARQKGLKVTSIQEITQSASQTSNSYVVDTFSVHTVEGVVLTTIIKEFWMDPDTGMMVVWVVEQK